MTDTTSYSIPKQLQEMLIDIDASIVEAMRVIDRGSHQIALVLDSRQKAPAVLAGVLTDGDIRRGLLSGSGLEDPIQPLVSQRFHSVSASATRSEALDLMKCHYIKQLPILGEQGELIGMHLLDSLIQPQELPNTALLLAGGRGTRLGKLTENVPKPMLKVAGRPILERIILNLIGSGIKRFVVSVNYLSDVIESHFGNGESFGCEIEYLHETEPLGTGGPLALMRNFGLEHPVFVLNGDLITEFDAAQMLHLHIENRNALTMGIKRYSHQLPFGSVEMEGDEVVGLVEKPLVEHHVNAGIYLFEPILFQNLPRGSYPITEVIEIALKSNSKVGAFHIDSWLDVGLPENLSQARGVL